MARHRPLLALAVPALLVLVGCSATAPVAAPSTTPPGAPSSAATPAVEPTPIVERVAAFDDDCGNVLTPAQVESILGTGAAAYSDWLAERAPDVVSDDRDPIALAGGIDCTWMAADDAQGLPQGMHRIAVLALPASVVAPQYRDELREARCDPSYDSVNCRLARTVGEVWLMARAGYGLESPPQALLTAALDAAAQNLTAFEAPVPAAREAEWWTLGDCDDLGERMDLSELLGSDYHSGYWEGSPQYEDRVLESAGVRGFCQWSSDSMDIPEGHEHYIVSLTLEPGGHWRWSDIAARDRTPVALRGAQEALKESRTSEYGFASSRGWATDGVNLVTVGVEGGDVAVEITERALAAMAAG